jgi:aminoglycoside phosphotransferase (APT) family kinase protein
VPELDLGELADRLRRFGVTDVRTLAGGASSLTFAARMNERRVVVKVAPPGVAPVRNRDVLRQARLLRALWGTQVPVPEVLHEDAGTPPDVPPLFVMSYVDGDAFEPLFDLEGRDIGAEVVAERLRDAARTMAALHSVRPESLGLGHEPVGGPAAELERWSAALETVDQSLVPGWREVGDAMRASVPAALPAAVVHGDFRLGNLLASGGRITAVVDWEIWSIGDPRVDMGWFMLNADPRTYERATRYAGVLPKPAELAEVYASAAAGPAGGAGPATERPWFEALASFKSAATWALIVKHNRRRSSPDGLLEAMAPVLPRLLARASEVIG